MALVKTAQYYALEKLLYLSRTNKKMYLSACAASNGPDQPVYPRSLFRAFTVHMIHLRIIVY